LSPLTKAQLYYNPHARHLAQRKQVVPATRPAGVSLQPQIAAMLNRSSAIVEPRGQRLRRWLRRERWRLIFWLRRERWRLILMGLVSVVTLGAIMMLATVLTHMQNTPADPPKPEVLAAFERSNYIMPAAIIQPVTAASINAQMKPDSQTVVVSVEPLPVPAAAMAQQVVITQGLIAGGVAGWFNDNVAGNQTFTCPDSLCGVYNPNTKLFICGGWLGIDGNKMSANFEVIKPVHTCTESTRIASDSRAALIYLSQSTRSALIGNTDQWPLLIIEVYADHAPFPVMTEGK
jgi:hypothetical protein